MLSGGIGYNGRDGRQISYRYFAVTTAGSYAFSYIGYNGTMAGGGDTEDTRWDDAVKYRLIHGPLHFGAMYKIRRRFWRLLLGLRSLDGRHPHGTGVPYFYDSQVAPVIGGRFSS
jgi:hypothetical protein